MNIRFTEHAMKRYAERIAGREDRFDAASYVATNREKIERDLREMVERGVEVYRGLAKDKKPTVLLVQGAWLLVMSPEGALITLFKKELGVDDERLNREVMSRAMEIIAQKSEAVAVARDKNERRITEIKEDIRRSEESAKEHRVLAKRLEEYVTTLSKERQALDVEVEDISADLYEFINKIVGEKYFGIK
ncbi:MAG: hypothetical protein LBE03_01215 [Candidatus Nomurabacteria bacterium]|nr:hypothetical protein [Candidatus Nomurabacteria bacterium]